MNEESKIIIAFVFNRAGKKEMTFSEFYLTLSMDLSWFTPEDAKAFTKNALENSLLKEEKELVKPGFDIDDVKIPLGFYPSKDVLKIPKKEISERTEGSLLDEIIKKIVEKSNLDEKTILKQIKEIEQEKNITIEIAALLVGKEYNIVFNDLLDKIKNDWD